MEPGYAKLLSESLGTGRISASEGKKNSRGLSPRYPTRITPEPNELAAKNNNECSGLARHRAEQVSQGMTLEEMTAQRDALLAARFRGVRTVEIDGRRVTYATDAEMAAAITDLERRIAGAQEGGLRRRILTSASKGL